MLRAVKAHGLPPDTVWQRLVELGHPPPEWLRLPEEPAPATWNSSTRNGFSCPTGRCSPRM
ncbi:hypothetical protein ACFQ60_23085 [Streptomyces zhihengii]